ncbi:hypothetical protein ACPA0F_09045 [Solibacillus silvestris]
MVDIVCAILSSAASILAAVVAKKISKSNKDNEQRAERRKEESLLLLEMTMASVELTEVCANALTGGHNNGNVEIAKSNVEKAKNKYANFQRRIVAEEIM